MVTPRFSLYQVLEEAVHIIGEQEEFLKRGFVSSINNLFKKSVLVEQSFLLKKKSQNCRIGAHVCTRSFLTTLNFQNVCLFSKSLKHWSVVRNGRQLIPCNTFGFQQSPKMWDVDRIQDLQQGGARLESSAPLPSPRFS